MALLRRLPEPGHVTSKVLKEFPGFLAVYGSFYGLSLYFNAQFQYHVSSQIESRTAALGRLAIRLTAWYESTGMCWYKLGHWEVLSTGHSLLPYRSKSSLLFRPVN